MSVTVTDRRLLSSHDGRSGARIETGRLEDGSLVYVKTADLELDPSAVVTGTATRELDLFRSGALDVLPTGLEAALVDVDVVDGRLVTVSTDLTDRVLTWDRVLDRDDVRRILSGAVALNRHFADAPPAGLCDLAARLTLMAPQRAASFSPASPDLASAVLLGWERFEDLVPAAVATAVREIHADPARLATRMSADGVSLAHGDLWLVNLALGPSLVLLDWGLATLGPTTLDLMVFCAGGMSNVALTRHHLLHEAWVAAREVVDADTFAAAEVWVLAELGWNKALDATTHPDPAKRVRERADLDFWVGRARAALESGVL